MGRYFWLRLITASAQFLRLSERFVSLYGLIENESLSAYPRQGPPKYNGFFRGTRVTFSSNFVKASSVVFFA